jgi:hypothetical protein
MQDTSAMTETKSTIKISLLEFITRTESEANLVLKHWIDKNTQFSTQFIIRQIVSRNEKLLSKFSKDKAKHEKVAARKEWLMQQDWNIFRQKLAAEFDTEHLTFIEANRLALRMNEYLLSVYRSIVLHTSSQPVKKAINHWIAQKTGYILQLKKEYDRLNTKT